MAGKARARKDTENSTRTEDRHTIENSFVPRQLLPPSTTQPQQRFLDFFLCSRALSPPPIPKVLCYISVRIIKVLLWAEPPPWLCRKSHVEISYHFTRNTQSRLTIRLLMVPLAKLPARQRSRQGDQNLICAAALGHEGRTHAVKVGPPRKSGGDAMTR